MGSAIDAWLGGGKGAPAAPSGGTAISRFLAAPAPRAKFNPSSIRDVPSLNKALRSGQINSQQWTSLFKQISGNNGKANFNPYSAKSIAGSAATAVKQTFVDPVKQLGTDVKQQVVSKVKTLSAPTSTQAERDALLNNQTAAKSPAFQAAVKGRKSGDNSIQGINAAQALAAKGGSPAQIKKVLDMDAAKVKTKNVKAVEDLGTVTGLYSGGEGVTGKLLSGALAKAKAGIGKDTAVNDLISAQRAAQVTTKANKTASVGAPLVKDATTTKIPVVGPTETASARQSVGSVAVGNADRTRIPVSGKSTQTVGKVAKSTDAAYLKQTDALTKSYNKELTQLEKLPSPYTQRVLQERLDTKYSGLQEKLDKQYGQTSVSFNGRSTATPVKLPKSALNPTGETKPFEPRTGSPTASKTTAVQATTPKPTTAPKPSTPATGEPKVSGSSIRTQAKAVEAGMESEARATGATYNTVSHKEEAAKAAQLLNDNPEKAQAIAMGARGDNASHEAAVYHAVANQAIEEAHKTGDFSKVTALASSPRHTAVSEAAQKLGAEGYNVNPHDPVSIMSQIAKDRQKVAKTNVAKEVATVKQEVKAAAPKITRQDWHSFIQELQCK